MENQTTRLIERWLDMKLSETDRKFQSSKNSWNSKVSMRGMTNGSDHIIGLVKIITETIRETAQKIFAEIDNVSSDPERFDLAVSALQQQMHHWHRGIQGSSRRLQNQTMLNRAIDPLLNQANSDISTLAELAKNTSASQAGDENDYLTLWLDDKWILLQREIAEAIKSLYAQLSAAGTLRSGYRIKQAIAIWEENTKTFAHDAFSKGKDFRGGVAAHNKVATKIRLILSEFESALSEIVFFPKGAGQPKETSAMRAARDLFETTKLDIERKILLAKMDFEQEVDADEPFSKSPDQLKQQVPRLSKIALHGWWQALDPATRSLPQDELLVISKAAFPGKFISRERIRELTGPRKRGKKPFSGKPTAN